MSRYNQGYYEPRNPHKYIGKKRAFYRSAWELTLMRTFDEHPSVDNWGSECISIPYQNPFTQRWTVYVPDFLVLYHTQSGKVRGMVYEVKPDKQTMLSEARSPRDKAQVALNEMKWRAAAQWCQKNGLVFQVLNEGDIYANTKAKPRPKRRPTRRR